MAMKHYFLDDYEQKIPEILNLLASLLDNYRFENGKMAQVFFNMPLGLCQIIMLP